jgi:hypothetical protein
MVLPKLANGSQPSEQTPLLSSASNGRARSPENGSATGDDNVHAIGDSIQGPLEPPIFPELGKPRSYSHSHWLAPDEDSNTIPELGNPPHFQENGLLAGLSKARFRLVYGGILLGYFVSANMLSDYIALLQHTSYTK